MELKTCPFCGNDAEIAMGGFGERFGACKTKGCVHFGSRWSTTNEDAAKEWNRRAEQPEQEECPHWKEIKSWDGSPSRMGCECLGKPKGE